MSLIEQVRTAIQDDRSIEATVEAVGMPEYIAYRLSNWVHKTVNVPSAYRDLQYMVSGAV